MQVHLDVGEHTDTHLSTTCKNAHTYYTVEAGEYQAVVLSNTLCKNMNTLHRRLSTK